MKILLILICAVISRAKHIKLRSGPGYDCEYCQPEQVHISFGCKLFHFSNLLFIEMFVTMIKFV